MQIDRLKKNNRSTLKNRLNHFLAYGDRPWNLLVAAMAVLIVLIMLAIAWLLWQSSAEARTQYGLKFLIPTFKATWNPVKDQFQAWPFIYGTLLTSLVALVLAVPISLGIAVFLTELSPLWLRLPFGWMVELLAAIPSVVFGLWGIFVFLPTVITPAGNILGSTLGLVPGFSLLFKGPVPASGSSRLAAGVILAIMIIPTIAAVTRDVFLAIPQDQREASLALGATRWETIWQVLIPYSLSGILGALILGLGRALGETMAVTMVIGNSLEGSPSLLRPGYTMSSVIANEFAEAVSQLHSQALIEIGFILFVMTLFLNLLARILVARVSRRIPKEARA